MCGGPIPQHWESRPPDPLVTLIIPSLVSWSSQLRAMEQVFRHMVGMCLLVLHFGLVCSAHTAFFPSPHNSPSPAPGSSHSPKISQAPVPAPESGSTGSPSPAPSSEAVRGPVSPPAPASIPIEVPSGSPLFAPIPAPFSAAVADDDSASQEKNGTDENVSKSSSRLSGGQKAGIAVGVLFGAAAVGTGGIIYKKRQENIRRAQYGFAARREQL